MTNPPTVITHNTLYTYEGSASAAYGAGNLLFYTDGSTIWNKMQLVMANGTGILGNGSTVQAALIAKQPGNQNIYYVFSLDLQGGPNGLRYSLVDMSLAAGMGSVTIKNATVSVPCTEQLTGVRHCNGIDLWIVTHELNNNNFRAFLLTASGLVPTPVVSAIGPAPPTYSPNNVVSGQGTLKSSPNGRKLGMTFFNGSNASEVAVFDFDRSTGIVSNYLPLIVSTTNYYGCEFSGDGTKFYTSGNNTCYQWELCAGSNSMILASQTLVGNQGGGGQLQLAPNGKIYVVTSNTQTLAAILNPNLSGSACNYTAFALSVASGSNGAGLPNFIGGACKNLPSFTYTTNPLISCATASFTAPTNPTIDLGCGASGYAVQGITWNFGQPLSGTANTSTLTNPTHNFGVAGTYTVKLIYHYGCGADTLYNNVVISGPAITVGYTGVTCSATGTATANVSGGTGPLTYTWMPSMQTTPTATVNPGSYTLTINDGGGNCTYTFYTIINPTIPFSGTVNATSSLACNGVPSGTAGINLNMGTGGTGLYAYNWSNSQSTPFVSGLAAGLYTVTVTDANCILTKTFQIVEPPAISLTVTSTTSSICAGINHTLMANALGGTGLLSYSWISGPATASYAATQTISGTNIYSVIVTDQNGCSKMGTIPVIFLPTPLLMVASVSICPKATATLIATGATNYTWLPGGNTGPTFTASPSLTHVYTVHGSFTNGCSSSAVATISVLKCVSVNEEYQGSPLLIYPNPVLDEIFIESEDNMDVIICDLTGQILIEQKLESGKSRVSAANLRMGIYLLKIVQNASYSVHKLIKLE
jgi:hypothetical protein